MSVRQANNPMSHLEDLFKRAVARIQSLPPDGEYSPSIDEKLKFYSLFKQATFGPNTTKKPAFYDVVAKTKWYGKSQGEGSFN